MTTYSELSHAMLEFHEAQERYWSRLEQKVNLIEEGVAQYLGKDGQTTRLNGEQVKYVTLGRSPYGNEFEPVRSASKLAVVGKEMAFTLRVIIEESPEHHYKVAFLQTISVQQEGGKLRFSIDEHPSSRVVELPADFNERHQEQLYEAVAQSIKAKFDASVFD